MAYRIISADSHMTEPPDLWTERLDQKYRDRAPRVVDTFGRVLAASWSTSPSTASPDTTRRLPQKEPSASFGATVIRPKPSPHGSKGIDFSAGGTKPGTARFLLASLLVA